MKNKTKITPEMQAMLNAAPEITNDEAGVKPGATVARGFAQFKEFINRNGRPAAEDPKVPITIRIPLSYADGMRKTGRGWQTRMSDYMVRGIQKGALGKVEI